MIPMNSARNIAPPNFPSVSLNVILCLGAPQNIIDIFQDHGTDPHGRMILCLSSIQHKNSFPYRFIADSS